MTPFVISRGAKPPSPAVMNSLTIAAATEQLKSHLDGTFRAHLDDDDIQTIQDYVQSLKSSGSGSVVPFSREEICAKLHLMSLDKTSGPSGISTDLLRRISQDAHGIDLIEQFLNQIFLHGTLPQKFKGCWVVLIRKVASVSFSKQFRPISQLEPLQKLYAGLLANRLQSTWPRMADQLGGAHGKQVLDALFCTAAVVTHQTVEDAHSVWVSLDIRAAFDSIQYKHLAEHVYNNTGPEYCLEGAKLVELIFFLSCTLLELEKSGRQLQTEEYSKEGLTRHMSSRM